jgi:hypothetical protein
MYLDALSFLEDERDAWRPFEALADLPDEQLQRPTGGGGRSGRDLMAHLAYWQEQALAAAKELAVGEQSPTIDRWETAWDTPEDDAWRDLSLDEVRRRFKVAAGELRGYLTVVPETRWVKHRSHLRTFLVSTIEHYDAHQADLVAVFEARR